MKVVVDWSRPRPLVFSLFLLLTVGRQIETQDLVMLISCDGFRYDYLSLGVTPNLDALRKNGVYVPKMKPIFPSITFVNHQTIVTGLHAETHGILANDVIDPETGEFVNMFVNGEEIATADKRIIPIWVSPQNCLGIPKVGCVINLSFTCRHYSVNL